MASLTYETKTRTGWRLRAYDAADARRRHSIWLGAIPEREARTIKQHIEAATEARKLGTPLPAETTRWLSRLAPRQRQQLAPLLGTALGTVSEASAAYLKWVGTRHRPSTLLDYQCSLEQLCDRFGARMLRSLDSQELDAWLSGRNVGTSTAGKHTKNIKTFLAWCRRSGWSDDLRLTSASTVRVGRKTYLQPEQLQQWIDHFRREPEMQCGLAIARWSGVRVPSELVTLTLGHVDWEAKRLMIPDAKRSKRSSRDPPIIRVTPLFPELRPYIERIWPRPEAGWTAASRPQAPLLPQIAADGAGFVRRAREGRDALHMQWPRLFTSVRATRENELITRFGEQAACEWIGNSPAVARRNYAMVSAETWGDATG